MTHPTEFHADSPGRKDIDRVFTAKVVQAYPAPTPIEDNMDKNGSHFSWEKPVTEVEVSTARPVSPWPHATAVVTRPEDNARAAHDYAKKASRDMAADLRKALLKGIGMVDVPVSKSGVDDLFE
jgi:hypothetical protein